VVGPRPFPSPSFFSTQGERGGGGVSNRKHRIHTRTNARGTEMSSRFPLNKLTKNTTRKRVVAHYFFLGWKRRGVFLSAFDFLAEAFLLVLLELLLLLLLVLVLELFLM
jgi:hypothetical protein